MKCHNKSTNLRAKRTIKALRRACCKGLVKNVITPTLECSSPSDSESYSSEILSIDDNQSVQVHSSPTSESLDEKNEIHTALADAGFIEHAMSKSGGSHDMAEVKTWLIRTSRLLIYTNKFQNSNHLDKDSVLEWIYNLITYHYTLIGNAL